jgi:glycosyltransferase involved in cell wall biosynthesis
MFYLGEFVAVKCAHEMFVTSRSLQQYVLHTWNHQTTYLPNGIFEHVSPFDFEQEVCAMGLEPYRYVVCVGRLMRDKAQHEVIAAFIRMKERAGENFSDLKLVLIGDVAHQNDSYRLFLEQQIEGRSDVIFAGVQTGMRLKALMKHARVGLSLSHSEGMPLSVLEMISFGVPMVVSDIDAHREIFGDDHAFIEVGNVERAAVQLTRLVCAFEDVRVIAGIIADRIAGKYRWEIIVARYCVALVATQTKFDLTKRAERITVGM